MVTVVEQNVTAAEPTDAKTAEPVHIQRASITSSRSR